MNKPPTYLLMTVTRMAPEKVWEALQILAGQAAQPGDPEINGLRQELLIESQEEPGRIIWLSTWDTPADSQAFMESPRYARLQAEIKPYLLLGPEWFHYSVLEDWLADQEQAERRKGGRKNRIICE